MTTSLDGQLVLWDFADGSMLKVVKCGLFLYIFGKKKYLVLVIFHQSMEFGVPLLKFGLRPGEEDPSIFFVIKKGEGIS